MSFSWTYLTRRFLLQNYRDYAAGAFIASFVAGSIMKHGVDKDDQEWTMQHVYTDDESDFTYRERTNKTDPAVKRQKIIAYTEKIHRLRAENERKAQLDAFNYLYGKNLQL